MERVTVRDVEVPAPGFGTARTCGRACRVAVTRALEAGYRHLDTAQQYDNETAVGDAVAAADVPREEIFLTTKIARENLAYDDVHASVDASRARLGVETIDLLLIHGPSETVPVAETIEAMNELQTAGAVDHVGVSNFSVAQLEAAMAASETPILTDQVEYHPFVDRDDLLAFCRDNDVALIAYSPLATGNVVDDDVLCAISERYDKTAAQVALRWLLQQPQVVPIPGSADPAHIVENADVFDFTLSDREMERIFRHERGLLDHLLERIDR